MSSRRTVIMMGVLLLLIAGYFEMPLLRLGMLPFAGVDQRGVRAFDRKDSISHLQLEQTASGAWKADFDYFYAGGPPDARLVIELTPAAGAQVPPLAYLDTYLRTPERGAHHLSADIHYPNMQGTTVRVTALMRSQMYGTVNAASQQVHVVIDWPDFMTYARNQRLATRSPADNLKQAQGLIDTDEDGNIHEARLMLDEMLEENPKLDPAYIELARIALKTNWGPEGLHQAEDLINTALQLRPDSTDAKTLLAYVYVHQGRFKQAAMLFKEVAATDTDNLWLLNNWGEMFAIQHQTEKAILKYREVIAHPVTHDRNDRPRLAAYEQLLALLADRRDFDGMEALYKQRIAEFGWGSCYSAGYTGFLLHVRGDVDGAIDSARRALKQSCDDAPSRELLGLAEYTKWAGSTGSQRVEALNQARIYLPMSARALYLLASSERTVLAARQLVTAGEPIDQKDNDNFDALAYALQNRDRDAVRRLIGLGARPDTPVGVPEVPVALFPVLDEDVADVRLLRRLGVRYSKLRYRGVTALDFAKQQGNQAMLSALGSGSTTL